MGCVLPAGLGQAPARQAALAAGLPIGVGATTVNKMCGSGMKAAMLAHDLHRRRLGDDRRRRRHGEHEQRALSARARARRLSHGPRPGRRFDVPRRARGRLRQGPADGDLRRGLRARLISSPARRRTPTRSRSLERANRAMREGAFAAEIAPVAVKARQERDASSPPTSSRRRRRPDKIPTLKPAFRDGGTVTAANSSSISDGAAALVLTRESEAERRGLTPLARIVGHATYAAEPGKFPTAPIGAIRRLFDKTGWSAGDGRPLRDQRGLRGGGDGGDARSRSSRTTRSTSTAAPARSAIRSAPRARASWSRCWRR